MRRKRKRQIRNSRDPRQHGLRKETWGIELGLVRGSDLNTQRPVFCRNPSAGGDNACHATAQGPTRSKPQNQKQIGSVWGRGTDCFAASSDPANLRKCIQGHAQRHFSPRKPSGLARVGVRIFLLLQTPHLGDCLFVFAF